MDAREDLKVRHTVTVGMSWFRNQQTKGISNFMERNESNRIDS